MNHETQVGKLKSLRSYWKYCVVYKHLAEFVEKRYKVSDIALKELTPAFITDFELFLRVEKNHCNNTVWSYMMPFRKIIYTAVNNGLLQRDPFFAYSITKEETKRGFLTKEEITLLINGTFKKKSYELIRDLFIFCTFTGLSWTDMANLTEANLQTSFDGHLWLNTNRQKRVSKRISDCWMSPSISSRSTAIWRPTESSCPFHATIIVRTALRP